MHVGKIFSIQLTLNFYFLGLLLLFSLAGMSGKVLLVFSAVLWHEGAHALMAHRLGYQVKEIELLPFGGVARIERFGDAAAGSEILVAAAGPLASLIMAGMSYFAWLKGGTAAEVLSFYFWVHMMLALFNLLPALPLDGGRIFRAILSLFIGYHEATQLAAQLSKVFCVLLFMLIVYEYLNVGTMNVTFLIAAIFLYHTAKSELAVAGFRAMRLLAFKKAYLSKRGLLPTQHFIARRQLTFKEVIAVFRPELYHVVIVVDDELQPCGTLSESDVWQGIQQLGIYATLDKLLKS